MKIVDIPDPIKVRRELADGRVVEPVMTFKEFISVCLDQNQSLGQGVSNVRKALKIMDSLEKAANSARFEDAEFEVIKASVDRASIVPSVARQVIAFYDAVENAQEVKTLADNGEQTRAKGLRAKDKVDAA